MAMQPAQTSNLRQERSAEASSTTSNNTSAAYVETIREGAIGAGIFRGQNSHFFTLSRAWKSTQTDKSGYSSRFYPGNAEAITNVVKQAAERCQELDEETRLSDVR